MVTGVQTCALPIYGIIKTTFDILEKNEYIETELIGDAVAYEKEIVG